MKWLSSIIVFLLFFSAFSQEPNIKFQNITISEGLSQSSVNTILQDKEGFIWIGTQDGLNMYDGYEFTVFKSNPEDPESLPNNFVRALYEDAEGQLWVGTEGGLCRYIKEKAKFQKVSWHSDFGPVKVTTITGSPEGKVWVGTENDGLVLVDPETLEVEKFKTQLSTPGSLPSNQIKTVFTDSDGQIWIGTTAGLCVYYPENNTFRVYRHNPDDVNTISSNVVWTIAEDSTGFLWVGTSKGLNKFNRSHVTPIFSKIEIDPKELLQEKTIISKIFVDDDQNVWLGTRGRGVFKIFYDIGKLKVQRSHHSDLNPKSLLHDEVYTIFQDRANSIWIGTRNGVSRFDPNKQGFIHITPKTRKDVTLPDRSVWSFAHDPDNGIWIGTREGVTLYDPEKSTFRNFTRSAYNVNTPNDNSALSLYIDSKGRFWGGFVDGLFRMKYNSETDQLDFQRVHYKDHVEGENDPRVYAILEVDDMLWIGTREGVSLLNIETGRYRFFRNDPDDPASIGANIARAIFKDNKGRIWIGTDEGGLNRVVQKGNKISFVHYKNKPTDPGSLSSNTVASIWQEKRDTATLWLGTYGGGLNKFNIASGKVERITSKTHGLENDVIYGVLGDNDGHLWLSTNRGLSRFNIKTGDVKNFSPKHGLQSNEFNTGAYLRTGDGRMLFGGINGFNIFRPDEIKVNTVPPTVVLTDFIVDNKPYEIGGGSPFNKLITFTNRIELPYDRSKFTLEFAGLHFSDPAGNQYKFIMEGLDEDYTVVGTERHAHYPSLPPGEYTFKVYAANSDGIWSREPATLNITIHPPFWKTGWFQAALFILVIGGGYMFYWMRVRTIRAAKFRLEKIVQDRTEEVNAQKELLEKEKEKTEKLLLNILPEDTAEELKSRGKAKARSYRRVSVMFADIRGFTQIAEQLKPVDLVTRLDGYFIKFDQIVEKYGLEKIKTIGDSYMCAGGVPVRNKENPIHTVLAALEMQHYMDEMQKEHEKIGEDFWEIRIGINTGEVIAGVIGTKRFAYDIWGNTVNVAARMEQGGEPGKVNVSGKTYELIEPYFECTYRGKIPAKNKGHIDMFFVDRIKPELSVDGLGLEPNQQFWDYVNLHLFSAINYMKAERYIMKRLAKELSPKLHYHGIHHAKDVTESAERIALMEGIKGEDLFLLQTAATYHDAGFVEQYDHNEPVGARMAEEILPRFGYTDDQIEIIADMIHATKIPHEPQTHLEEILCDADLDYLGRDDFHEIADTLRRELREHGKIESDRAWDEIQVKFLSAHRYFTESAIKKRQAKKEKHIEEIKKRLEENKYKD